MPTGYTPSYEKLIEIEDNRSVRVKAIETDDFSWVFSAFGAHQPLAQVSPKILRALLRRSYDLVRHDIPRRKVEVNFDILKRAAEAEEGLATLYGIANIGTPSSHSAEYPYTVTKLAIILTDNNKANYNTIKKFFVKIKDDKKFDIRASDNIYHSVITTGTSKNSISRKYSNECLLLLQKVMKGEPYEVKL